MWTLCQCLSGRTMDLVTSVSDAVKTESLLTPSSSVELKEITQVSRFKQSPASSNVSRKRTGCGVSTPCISNKCRKVSNETDEDAEPASETKAGFLLHEHANGDFSASSAHPPQASLSTADTLNAKDSLAHAMEYLFRESENLIRKTPRFRPSASELRDPLPVIKMNMEQELDFTEFDALPEREHLNYMSLAMEQRTWMRLENNEWMQMIERGVDEIGSLSDVGDAEGSGEEDVDDTRASEPRDKRSSQDEVLNEAVENEEPTALLHKHANNSEHLISALKASAAPSAPPEPVSSSQTAPTNASNGEDFLARAMKYLFSDSVKLVPRFRPSASELRDPLPVIKMNMEQELDFTEFDALPEREHLYYMSLAMEARTWMRLENNEWMQMIERGVDEIGSLSDLGDTSDMEDPREEGGDDTRAS